MNGRKKSTAKNISDHSTPSFNIGYGKVLLPVTFEATPYEVFEKLANFNNLIEEIVIPQTKLYSQQKGHIFLIEAEEVKVFFFWNQCGNGLSCSSKYKRLLVY